MKYQNLFLSVLVATCICTVDIASATENVGTLPSPTLTNVKLTANAEYNAGNKLYTYSYTVSNGATSTGRIFSLNLDMAREYVNFPEHFNSELTLPLGGQGTATTFADTKAILDPLLLPPGYELVPYGILIPVGWSGDMTRDGYAGFWARDSVYRVHPGDSKSGIKLFSPGVPVIEEMVVVPFWVPVFESEPTETEQEKAGQIEREIQVRIQTLAPAGVDVLSWSAFQHEIAQAIQLGWIPDVTLAQQIQSQLEAANAAIVQEDGTAAKEALQQLLATVAAAPKGAIRTETRKLVKFNAEALIRTTPDTPIPVTPKYNLAPAESTYVLGETATLVVSVVNTSNHNKPLAGYPVRLRIVSGPNQDAEMEDYARTDSEGLVEFSYQGHRPGTDKIWLYKRLPSIMPSLTFGERDLPSWVLDEAWVHWQGGADLVVPFFIPPVIKTQGGKPITLTDLTQNFWQYTRWREYNPLLSFPK